MKLVLGIVINNRQMRNLIVMMPSMGQFSDKSMNPRPLLHQIKWILSSMFALCQVSTKILIFSNQSWSLFVLCGGSCNRYSHIQIWWWMFSKIYQLNMKHWFIKLELKIKARVVRKWDSISYFLTRDLLCWAWVYLSAYPVLTLTSTEWWKYSAVSFAFGFRSVRARFNIPFSLMAWYCWIFQMPVDRSQRRSPTEVRMVGGSLLIFKYTRIGRISYLHIVSGETFARVPLEWTFV